jgi:hypothetical protein
VKCEWSDGEWSIITGLILTRFDDENWVVLDEPR